MDINRGLADHAQAASIIREYLRRRETTHAFAEWFSIDPPFPDGVFGDERLVGGAYVNGGIMPLVGGELARAAFEHGFETYGVDILRRYYEMISSRGETYLWYHPDGRPCSVETSTSPEAQPTDGWGSSAMAWALIEGLAGVVDAGRTLDAVRLSPRWAAAGVDRAEVQVGYEASGAVLRYAYSRESERIALRVSGEPRAIALHLLLPSGTAASSVSAAGRSVPFDIVTVESSTYVDVDARVLSDAVTDLEVDLSVELHSRS
jgi:hypothetical protein